MPTVWTECGGLGLTGCRWPLFAQVFLLVEVNSHPFRDTGDNMLALFTGASLVGRVDDTTRASLLCKVFVLTHTHTYPHIQYVYAHTDTHTHVLIMRGSTLTRTLVQYFPEDELEPQAAAPRPSAPFTPAGGPTVCMPY